MVGIKLLGWIGRELGVGGVAKLWVWGIQSVNKVLAI